MTSFINHDLTTIDQKQNDARFVSPSSKTVGVVLLNWNSGSLTLECLDSLFGGQRKPDLIVVVDNASSDGSPDLLTVRYPNVTLIRNTTNLGFTGGNNVGIRFLMEHQAEYIWILNNDTLVAHDCLNVLVNWMTEHEDIAACSAKILYADPPDRLWYAGSEWSSLRLLGLHRGIGETDKGQYDDPGDTLFLDGCCMFIRRNALIKVGYFDEQFFAYNEDIDWCFRAHRLGFRLAYVPKAVLWHRISASIQQEKRGTCQGTSTPRQQYLTYRNRLFIIRRYAPSRLILTTAVFMVLNHALFHTVALFVLGRFRKLYSVLLGVREGLTSRLRSPESIQLVATHKD